MLLDRTCQYKNFEKIPNNLFNIILFLFVWIICLYEYIHAYRSLQYQENKKAKVKVNHLRQYWIRKRAHSIDTYISWRERRKRNKLTTYFKLSNHTLPLLNQTFLQPSINQLSKPRITHSEKLSRMIKDQWLRINHSSSHPSSQPMNPLKQQNIVRNLVIYPCHGA